MSQGSVGDGPRLVHFTEDAVGPAGTSAREALMIVTPWSRGGQVRSSRLLEQYRDRAGLDVTFFGFAESREIHVIGQNRLADDLRSVLRAGEIPEWKLRELPAEQIPVRALYTRLSSRSSKLGGIKRS